MGGNPDKMKLLRHPVASLVIFATLVALCISIYDGFENAYSTVRGDTQNLTDVNLTDGNIMEQFREMNLIEGVSDISSGITELSPSAGTADILGGLASVGIGALKTITGLVTAPVTITIIITRFYAGDIPATILGGLVTLIMVYVVFLLLSAYLRSDI